MRPTMNCVPLGTKIEKLSPKENNQKVGFFCIHDLFIFTFKALSYYYYFFFN